MIILRLRNKVYLLLDVGSGAAGHDLEIILHCPAREGQWALNAWWHSISSSLPSQNSLYFGMFLILVTWLIACLSIWFVLKKRNVWVTVSLGAVMLLFNLSNLPNNYYYFLPLYIFVCTLVDISG